MIDKIQNEFYSGIRRILEQARAKAYVAVNFAMVEAYWEIGKQITEEIGDRAEYGKLLLQELSKRLTEDYGKGFDVRNLRNMRQFYNAFQIRNAVRSELSWTHYRLISKIENERARQFYLEECVKANWSTRQLERQIYTSVYERMLMSKDKEGVIADTADKEPTKRPEDIIKDPYVLEFLGLEHAQPSAHRPC